MTIPSASTSYPATSVIIPQVRVIEVSADTKLIFAGTVLNNVIWVKELLQSLAPLEFFDRTR
jgi:hypothetical protein